MFNATNARAQTIDNATVETEIALLNLNVISAISTGNASCVVAGNTVTHISNTTVSGTPMTSTAGYYAAWQGIGTDTVKPAQMQAVIDNFTKMGYTISRQSWDGINIYWTISW